MDMTIDHADHLTFLKHLDQSHEAVWRVANWINKKGYFVTVPPTTKSATHQEWEEHADNGDLLITKSLDTQPRRVEVKRRGINFTGPKDWPHRNFIVCAAHAWDRATPKPYAVFVLSSDMKYAGVVKAATKDKWYIEKKKDSRYIDYTQDFYVIDLEYVDWITL